MLRAALWEGDAGRDAFGAWAASSGEPTDLPADGRQPLRELGPQLDGARRRHGIEPAARGLATLLRAAGDRERRRWGPYCDAVVDLVGDDPALVSGGLATSLAAYEDPGVRHSHDLERLTPVPAEGQHPSGLPWADHGGRLPPVWGVEDDLDELRARAVPDDRLGPTLHRLSTGDLLVVVLVHSVATRQRGSVRWASDAHLLAAAATEDDWSVFVRTVGPAGLAAVVRPGLRFLQRELGSRVPDGVLAELRSAPRADHRRAETVLVWAHAGRERPPGPRANAARVRRGVARRLARR